MTNGNLEARVSALETQMQDIRDLLLQTAIEQRQLSANLTRLESSQQQTSQQLQQTSQQQRQTDQLLQNFIRESSRVTANIGEQSSRADAAATANRESIARLTNTLENTNQRLGETIEYLRNRGQ